MLALRAVFGSGTADGYWAVLWLATVLVVGMVVVALARLYSSDTSVLGGTLALVAMLHAPLFMGMRFGMANPGRMQTFDEVSRAILYPLLGLLGLLVQLRPLRPTDRHTSGSERPA